MIYLFFEILIFSQYSFKIIIFSQYSFEILIFSVKKIWVTIKIYAIIYKWINNCFQAEQLIVKGFPEKIVKLNEILETPGFCHQDLSKVHQELNIPIPDPILLNHSQDGPPTKRARVENNLEDVPGTKVMVLPNGPVPCNKPLCDIIHVVKPYIRQLLEDSNLVSWHFFKIKINWRLY